MRLNVDIKQEIYDEFVEITKSEGRSLSDVVRMLVLDWMVEKRREKLQLIQLSDGVNKDGKVVG